MNNKFGITDKSYAVIMESIKNTPEIEQAKIFGSRAMGNFKKGSDIDIAVYGNAINDQIIYKIKNFLNNETIIPYYIDIMNYKQLKNKDLKKHIDQFGILFYNKSIAVNDHN